jgi:hypothetical protein
LIHYTDERGERRLVNLNKDVFKIGRTRDNDLTIDNHSISRYHAEVVFDGQSYTFIDKRSRCGSFARRERISEWPLSDGDTISLGSEEEGASLTFFFPQLRRELENGHPPRVRRDESSAAADGETGQAQHAVMTSLGMLNLVTRKLMLCQNDEEIAEQLLDLLSALGTAERLVLMLYDRQRRELRPGGRRDRDGQGLSSEPSPDLMARVFISGETLAGFDNDCQRFFVCLPLASSRHVWGVCYASARARFTREEQELLTAIGHQAGSALETIHLLEDQRRTVESLIHALSLSIDARDEITAGHSERVAAYAVAIARHLGLSAHEQRVIYYAALLHDLGKIGVRDDVLCKPAQLTPDEYEVIKQHPLYTLKILSKINFSEELADVPLVAGSHHERPDGSGYPRGLHCAEIPIGARVIAVADFFDALTVERHYRKPLPAEEVLEMIEAGRDTQFDGRVIDAFLRYYREELPRQCRMASGGSRGED